MSPIAVKGNTEAAAALARFKVATASNADPVYKDSDLTTGATYVYKISAANACSAGKTEARPEIMIRGMPNPMAPFTKLAASVIATTATITIG